MPILETQGIRISPSLPSYNTCPTVRFAPFNDLDIVGASATSLDIKGIKFITLYYYPTGSEKYIVGIDAIYKLSNGELSSCILHGARTGDRDTISVEDDERIIAVFMGTSPPDINHIRALRFVKTNLNTGVVCVEPQGECPELEGSVEYSAVFGNIVAFHGITLRGVPVTRAKVYEGLPGRVFSIGFQTRSGV